MQWNSSLSQVLSCSTKSVAFGWSTVLPISLHPKVPASSHTPALESSMDRTSFVWPTHWNFSRPLVRTHTNCVCALHATWTRIIFIVGNVGMNENFCRSAQMVWTENLKVNLSLNTKIPCHCLICFLFFFSIEIHNGIDECFVSHRWSALWRLTPGSA